MMMPTKFGVNQLKAPTPSKVNNSVGIVSAVLGVFVIWLGTQKIIPQRITTDIDEVSGLLLSILQVIRPFFGVHTTQTEVNIEDVTAMKET